MKINWLLRLKNKTTLLSLLCCVIAFIYQVLGLLGVTTPISEDQTTQLAGLFVNLLAGIGVLVDPTTKGLSDSDMVLYYNKPR